MSSLIVFGIVRSRRFINPKISHLQQIGGCDTPRRFQCNRISNEIGYAIAFYCKGAIRRPRVKNKVSDRTVEF
ncbi:hypothetical protein WKK05_24635 [Nostoc sp. UHCC 0302]|uniref:hypothetical protein n=1 Tax=Nostoc sp. UHCC 0302 TaxID=3134896 RepID=UPI00311CB5BB